MSDAIGPCSDKVSFSRAFNHENELSIAQGTDFGHPKSLRSGSFKWAKTPITDESTEKIGNSSKQQESPHYG